MFEQSGLSGLSDEALIAEVTDATRAEAAAAARRLAAIAEVTARHCEDEDESSALKLIDGWALAKAEISAACTLSPRAASAQMRIAMALRDRLPRTAEVFARGAISAKVIAAITWRTQLVCDEEALVISVVFQIRTPHPLHKPSDTSCRPARPRWPPRPARSPSTESRHYRSSSRWCRWPRTPRSTR
ncbi:DUF222 domain-containing protein [Mycolicibacterium neoaurum]|uniref:DUF222 domain-containing protein n=1 Tax=Mycolicibacterium neoaurum TaxID=1795 RepID=UPI00248BB990|nr:DUF222 domain-containing protein [Mycolicibacterium neoaurum]WBS06617.1 DUF222 domain-containing protein [Mycolicibacterium neoaurum]